MKYRLWKAKIKPAVSPVESSKDQGATERVSFKNNVKTSKLGLPLKKNGHFFYYDKSI